MSLRTRKRAGLPCILISVAAACLTPGIGPAQTTARVEVVMRRQNLLVWNFSNATVPVEISLTGHARELCTRHITLDPAAASDDENARLRPEPFTKLPKGTQTWRLPLDPYALHYWSFE